MKLRRSLLALGIAISTLLVNPTATLAAPKTTSNYILPYSDSKQLSEKDLKGLDAEELRYARNEIYARHGRLFKDKEMQKFFETRAWYHGEIAPEEFNDDLLTDVELKNAALISKAESHIQDYLLPTSDSEYLDAEDLAGFTSKELRLARNEIFARHGRKFGSSDLKLYFESKSWYKGTLSSADFNDSVLNKFEWANVNLINDVENGVVKIKKPQVSPTKKMLDSYGYYDGSYMEVMDGSSLLQVVIDGANVREEGAFFVANAGFRAPVFADLDMKKGTSFKINTNPVMDGTDGFHEEDTITSLGDNTFSSKLYPELELYAIPVTDNGNKLALHYYFANMYTTFAEYTELWIRKDAVVECGTPLHKQNVSYDLLCAGPRYTNIYLDENGYVTRMVEWTDENR